MVATRTLCPNLACPYTEGSHATWWDTRRASAEPHLFRGISLAGSTDGSIPPWHGLHRADGSLSPRSCFPLRQHVLEGCLPPIDAAIEQQGHPDCACHLACPCSRLPAPGDCHGRIAGLAQERRSPLGPLH